MELDTRFAIVSKAPGQQHPGPRERLAEPSSEQAWVGTIARMHSTVHSVTPQLTKPTSLISHSTSHTSETKSAALIRQPCQMHHLHLLVSLLSVVQEPRVARPL